MTHSLAIRLNPANPDHHLWNNNGTWFVHYTIHPTPLTKQRVRKSLRTKNLIQARARRDQLLFKEARAKTGPIKCDGATVKNFPTRNHCSCFQVRSPQAVHEATRTRVAWNKGPHRGATPPRSTAVCGLSLPSYQPL